MQQTGLQLSKELRSRG